MNKCFTYNLADDFIAKLASFIEDNYLKEGKDLSRLAIVFGGRRPHLFLGRELSKRAKKSLIAPASFSIDEFVEYILAKKEPFSKISDLDASFLIYNLAGSKAPDILEGRREFSQFLPWAREILAFIEQLDLEDPDLTSLKQIQANAAIGYDVPQSINILLNHLVSLRGVFHDSLIKGKAYTRGLMYLLASKNIPDISFDEFDSVLFCNFFYLHKTEEAIMKSCREKNKAILFFQGDAAEWSVLGRVSKNLACPIRPQEPFRPDYKLSLYCGFDLHSQVCLVREILKKIKRPQEAVIVLPEPGSIIPLLSEVSSCVNDFNVSLGYPLKRSSMYSLFECIFKAQETKKGSYYYSRDYLRVLSHPLVKNLNIVKSSSVTRVLVHKIEEVLTGVREAPVSGALFIKLHDLLGLGELYELILDMTGRMDIKVKREDLKRILEQLHDFLFLKWQKFDNIVDFSSNLEEFLDFLVLRSPLEKYPLNIKITQKLYMIQEELENTSFKKERFPLEDIFKIFKNKLDAEIISFSGSPLKGLQILGLFETRSLNFKHVIVLDANESVLPKLKIYEPLIPRDVMMSLGLNRLEKEEEIQRYQFMRLISGAESVDLVYQKSEDKEKSRFIEELNWLREKRSNSLDVLPARPARFQVRVSPGGFKLEKRPNHIRFLKDFQYSSTSINTYLNCPLRFYYQYVLGLKESQDLLEEPEAVDVGNFIHELLHHTFSKFVGGEPEISENFRKYFFRTLDKKFESEFAKKMTSDAFLLKELLIFRLSRFLDNEDVRQIKELLCVEEALEENIKLGRYSLRFKCKIDRIDRLVDDSLLIIDYKTGSSDIMPANAYVVESAAGDRRALKEAVKSFQLPLYLYFLQQRRKGSLINAALYPLKEPERGERALKKMFKEDEGFSERERILGVFMKALEYIVLEILDPQTPFTADQEDAYYCKNCPFFYLCR